jgi:hypothetical protein
LSDSVDPALDSNAALPKGVEILGNILRETHILIKQLAKDLGTAKTVEYSNQLLSNIANGKIETK